MEVADGVGCKALHLRLVAVHLGQAADAMSFEAPVQRRSGEVRDRGRAAEDAVVQRQQRMPSERDDDRLLLARQNG